MKNDLNIFLPVKYNVLKIDKYHVDTSTSEDGTLHKILAFSTIQTDETNLVFSKDFGSFYSNETKQNILSEFLNIELYNIDSVISFFNKFGFLCDFSNPGFHKCNLKNLWNYIEMLKDVILLKIEISKDIPNVDKLLKYCFSIINNNGCMPSLVCTEDEIDNLNPYEIIFPLTYSIFNLEYDPETENILGCKFSHPYEPSAENRLNELVSREYLPVYVFRNIDNKALYLLNHIYELKKFKSLDEITSDVLDDYAISNLKEIANDLCDIFFQKYLTLNTKYDSNHKYYLEICNSSAAIFLTLSQMNFDNYVFDNCQKPSCKNFFIRRKKDTRSCYCCTAHGKNVAQAKYRKKHPQM